MYVTKVWQGYIIKSAAWLFAKDWEYTASQGVAYDARAQLLLTLHQMYTQGIICCAFIILQHMLALTANTKKFSF